MAAALGPGNVKDGEWVKLNLGNGPFSQLSVLQAVTSVTPRSPRSLGWTML